MSQGLVLSNVLWSSNKKMQMTLKTNNKNNNNNKLGFWKPTSQAWTLIHWKSVWRFSVNNTFTVLVSHAPYYLFVLMSQAQVFPSEKGSEWHWIPQHRLGECWVYKFTTCPLSTFLVHFATVDHSSVRTIHIFVSAGTKLKQGWSITH